MIWRNKKWNGLSELLGFNWMGLYRLKGLDLVTQNNVTARASESTLKLPQSSFKYFVTSHTKLRIYENSEVTRRNLVHFLAVSTNWTCTWSLPWAARLHQIPGDSILKLWFLLHSFLGFWFFLFKFTIKLWHNFGNHPRLMNLPLN